MEQAINNYKKALMAHMEAQKDELRTKDKLKKTRHALLIARDEMRSLERETLEEDLRTLADIN